MPDLWFEKKVRPRVKGACQLVRYADDFICMVQYADDARRIEQAMRGRFAKFGLELHPDKTRVITFDVRVANRRKEDRRSVGTFDFLGLTHYWGKSRSGHWKLHRKTKLP